MDAVLIGGTPYEATTHAAIVNLAVGVAERSVDEVFGPRRTAGGEAA